MDEAETLTEQSLEYIRRLRDIAGIGIVLTGTERLFPMVHDPRGRFGQISSRVGFWPPVIKSITEEDSVALARSALAGDGVEEQIDDEVLDALWQVCGGSARLLCEAIIPGVRDYGLRRGLALSPGLIFKVGQDVLGFNKRRA
jgi:DNA transposition AAA+ family ATPase